MRAPTRPWPLHAVDRRWRRAAALVVTLLLAAGVLVATSGEAVADTGDVGSVGPSHAGTGTPTGTKRPENVLWFNDGSWWGNLWDTRTSDFHIFRFDPATNQWTDTGVTTEPRANTHHDVLWDGTTLYVASHPFVNDGLPAVSGFPSTLRRYSYNPATKTYTLLSTSQINNQKTETLVIDKDSTGRLWATWQQANQIWVNATGTDGTTWGTPFALPGGSVTVDDISSLIAFGPGKMGLMFDREDSADPSRDGFFWSVHVDGAGVTDWTTPVPVATGTKVGDDHLNLKWLDSSGGRVFAAVKTSFTSASQPLIELLSMDRSGSWTQTTIAKVSECPDRVIVLIDEAAQRLRTFATYPKPSGTTNAGVCTSSGGAIYEKSSPLDNLSFTTDKTLRILDADQYVHNVSSTKQNIDNSASGGRSTAGSGAMVIADVNATSTYWYYYDSSGSTPPGDTTPPETTITAGPTGTVTSSSATFEFSSSEAGSTFQCALDGGAFAACTSPASWSGLAQGQHTFAVRATDPAGNTDTTPATRSWTVGTGSGGGIVRTSSSSVTNSTASTTVRIPAPTGVAPGDVMVSCLSLSGGSVTATGTPAGWTPLAAVTAQSNPKVFGYYKVATSSESSAYSWTTTSSVTGGGAIADYTGTSGPDGSAMVASGAAATSGTVGQVTTSTAGAMLVGCMGVNSSTVTISSPAGMSEVVETGDRRFELSEGAQPVAGPSGAKTWAFSASRAWAGWLAALRPQ